MPWASDSLFFSLSMLCIGLLASSFAASFAAHLRPFPPKLRFSGENIGRLPSDSISLAAERALLALAATAITPQGNRFESRPTMKYSGASAEGKRSTPRFTALKSENRSVFTRSVTGTSAPILSLDDERAQIATS